MKAKHDGWAIWMIAPRSGKIKLSKRLDPIETEVRWMQNKMLSLAQGCPSSSKFQLRLKLNTSGKIQVRHRLDPIKIEAR